jgi:hypothetical protein
VCFLSPLSPFPRAKGYGWGWVTLPNGIWNGALTWSQCDDAILLHALPMTDTSNMMMDSIDVYNTMDAHSTHVEASQSHTYVDTANTIEDIAAEDYDYAVDCGDFIF